MSSYDLQGIELKVPLERAHAFIADPQQLPRWTQAFASVTDGRAVMRTPNGEVEIDLAARATLEQGTVDWIMTFPGGSVSTAFSRLVEIDQSRCVFSFVLLPPPLPLEQLEGVLEEQSRTLAKELENLKRILEERG